MQTSVYISRKFWVGRNLNTINQWGKPQTGENQNFKVQWGGSKREEGHNL